MRSLPQGFEGEEFPEQDMGPSSLQQEIAEVEKEVVSEESASPVVSITSSGKLLKALSEAGISMKCEDLHVEFDEFKRSSVWLWGCILHPARQANC